MCFLAYAKLSDQPLILPLLSTRYGKLGQQQSEERSGVESLHICQSSSGKQVKGVVRSRIASQESSGSIEFQEQRQIARETSVDFYGRARRGAPPRATYAQLS